MSHFSQQSDSVRSDFLSAWPNAASCIHLFLLSWTEILLSFFFSSSFLFFFSFLTEVLICTFLWHQLLSTWYYVSVYFLKISSRFMFLTPSMNICWMNGLNHISSLTSSTLQTWSFPVLKILICINYSFIISVQMVKIGMGDFNSIL